MVLSAHAIGIRKWVPAGRPGTAPRRGVPTLPLRSCVTLGKSQGWMGNTGSHYFPPENFAHKVSDIKDEALRHDYNLSK